MFKQKKLSLGARFGLQLASFFLGLMLFASAIATAALANFQNIMSADGISGIVRTIISAPAQVRPRAPITVAGEGGIRLAPSVRTYQMPRREEPGDVAADLTEQVIGMFYEALGEEFTEVLPVSLEEFTQLIEESTVKNYVAEKTTALIVDYFNDEVTTTFEAEEVVQLIQENAALIESITGEPIPDDIAQQIGEIFDNNEIVQVVEKEGLAGFMKVMGGEEAGEIGSAVVSSDPLGLREMVKPIQDIASPTNLMLGIVTCLILVAAIILINCRQLGKGLRRVGYPLIFAGGIHFLLVAGTDVAAELLNAMTEGDAAAAQFANMIPKLLKYVLERGATLNIAILSLGIAAFVAGIVLPIVLHYIPKKTEDSNEIPVME